MKLFEVLAQMTIFIPDKITLGNKSIYKVIEARRNPELNKKFTVEQILANYYKKDLENQKPTYFMSFTRLLKVGINPNNEFGSPTAVYAYPIRYVCNENGKYNVPFKGIMTPDYIQILKITTDKVCYGSTYNDYQKDFLKLEKYCRDVLNKPNFQLSSLNKRIEDSAKLIAKWAHRSMFPIDKLWALTEKISILLSGRIHYQARWNHLFRYLNYDVLIDDNLAFICDDTLTQAIFFTPKSYKHIYVIDYKPDKK